MTAKQIKQANDTAQEIAWAVAHAIIDGENEDLDYLTIKQLTVVREIISLEAFNILQVAISKFEEESNVTDIINNI